MEQEKQIDKLCNDLNKIFDEEYRERRIITAYHTAKGLYEQGYRQQNEWISVEERLPTENGDYLVYTKYGYIEIERYKMWDDDDLDGGYWWELEGRVTHWMPLPEAPKMKGGE